MRKSPSLKGKVATSVAYLSFRRLVATVLGTVGTLFLARVLGPQGQGLFITSIGVQSYALMIGLIGIRPYLIKNQLIDNDQNRLHLAFCFEAIFGFVLAFILTLVALGFYWQSQSAVALMALALFSILPILMMREVPLALLESRFEYKKSALIETMSQLIYYSVAIGFVSLGYGPWGLVIGYLISELVTAICYFWAANYRPRWYWNFYEVRSMLSYAVTFALSGWASGLQNLVPSLVVFPILGAAAVGYIGMAERLIGLLSFAKGAVGRAAFPAFAQLQGDRNRLIRAVEEGAALQVLGLGLIYAGASLFMPYLVPLLLGTKWSSTIISWLFVMLSIRSLISGLTALEGIALSVTGKNLLVFYSTLINSVILGASTLLLLSHYPSFWGTYAYGVGGIIAAVVSGAVRHVNFNHHIGRRRVGLALLWFLASSIAMVAPLVSFWLYCLSLFLVVLFPHSRRTLYQVLLQGVRFVLRNYKRRF